MSQKVKRKSSLFDLFKGGQPPAQTPKYAENYGAGGKTSQQSNGGAETSSDAEGCEAAVTRHLSQEPSRELPRPPLPYMPIFCATVVALAAGTMYVQWNALDCELSAFEHATADTIESLRLATVSGLDSAVNAAAHAQAFAGVEGHVRALVSSLAGTETSVAEMEAMREAAWGGVRTYLTIVLAAISLVSFVVAGHAVFIYSSFRSGWLARFHLRFPHAGTPYALIIHILTIASMLTSLVLLAGVGAAAALGEAQATSCALVSSKLGPALARTTLLPPFLNSIDAVVADLIRADVPPSLSGWGEMAVDFGQHRLELAPICNATASCAGRKSDSPPPPPLPPPFCGFPLLPSLVFLVHRVRPPAPSYLRACACLRVPARAASHLVASSRWQREASVVGLIPRMHSTYRRRRHRCPHARPSNPLGSRIPFTGNGVRRFRGHIAFAWRRSAHFFGCHPRHRSHLLLGTRRPRLY